MEFKHVVLSWFLILQVMCVCKGQNYLESEYIECYHCNSRDIFCGKRVTDTNTATIKCPKSSKCLLFTSKRDNNYVHIHRGCSYGMEFSEANINNGCFVDEHGSAFCFCDFNRCNAASIIDLRNLVEDTPLRTGTSVLTKKRNRKPSIKREKSWTHQEAKEASWVISTKNVNKRTSTSANNLGRLISIYNNLSTATQPRLQKLVKKVIKILSTKRSATVPTGPNFYRLSINDTFSKNILNNLTFREKFGLKAQDKFSILLVKRSKDKNSTQIVTEKNKEKSSYGTELDSELNDFVNQFSYNNLNKNKPDQDKPSARFFLKLSPLFATASFTPITNSTTKFTSFTTKKITKPSTRLTSISSAKTKQHETTRPCQGEKSVKISATKKSKEKKLTTKLIANENDIRDLNTIKRILNKINEDEETQVNFPAFKCPSNGLFTHPVYCSRFLSCVDFGTQHERFYVFNCPASLFFNVQLQLCDYPENVPCFNAKSNF